MISCESIVTLSSSVIVTNTVVSYLNDRVTLTKTPQPGFIWNFAIPPAALDILELDPDNQTTAAVARLLATSLLPQLSDPLAVDKVSGPERVTRLFCEAYTSLLLEERGIRAKAVPNTDFSLRVSYATRDTLPPLSATAPTYDIAPATEADLDGAAQLYIAFQLEAIWHAVVTKEQALSALSGTVEPGFLWVCKVDGVVVGLTLLGRPTGRTISIRNVYVTPEHRRKGIADAMVQTVMRYYLGVPAPGVPEGPPAQGWKEEINLNMSASDRRAERVYKRAGFLLPDWEGDVPTGGVDPVTGRRGWYISTPIAVEVEAAASTSETQ